MRGLISLTLIMLGTLQGALKGQDIGTMIQQGMSLEKSFRDQEALQKFTEVLAIDPLNLVALCKGSELANMLGKRQESKDKQKQYYNLAAEYARRAIRIDPRSADANIAMAISLGRIALISSGEEKIKAVKEIKNYADRAIQADPANFKGYHVLGKWHYEVSDLSSVERWLVKITYGGLPPSSLDEAAKNYEKSLQLNPAFLLNYLELAKTFSRKDEDRKAVSLLEKMLTLPNSSSDDPKIKALGRKMLDDLKN